ncbi:hypothetical protein BT67DRAFT_441909 [Trichocladium antarcticum]|uniref:Uncharacterized protein n=1 Tax=Trichocladium antarcticum TaxID=1450529 RepID=A0AAN6ZEC6_9PEZI|nr:hypothetical protein BT67DRAFT_441909 [Trichocladium antarcticum]
MYNSSSRGSPPPGQDPPTTPSSGRPSCHTEQKDILALPRPGAPYIPRPPPPHTTPTMCLYTHLTFPCGCATADRAWCPAMWAGNQHVGPNQPLAYDCPDATWSPTPRAWRLRCGPCHARWLHDTNTGRARLWDALERRMLHSEEVRRAFLFHRQVFAVAHDRRLHLMGDLTAAGEEDIYVAFWPWVVQQLAEAEAVMQPFL